MRIRTGNHTIYNGIICQLFAVRHESPIPKKEILYQVCYNSIDRFNFVGFDKHSFEELHCRTFLLSELDNAFYIKTFGIYGGIKVKIFEFRPNNKLVHIISVEKVAQIKFNFLDMGNYYLKEIQIEELEKIWEERSQSEYDLPLPEGLKEYEALRI